MMTKGRTFIVAAAIAMATSGVARADILIGVAGPMTGSNAAFGEQLRRGAEKAVADINAKGGVLGQKLVLKIGDDACDPKQAVSVANDMVAAKVAYVAGHFCSSSSIPASSVYNEANILMMSPASTNPKLTDQGLANVFRVCGRDDDQGPTAAKYVVEHFKGKNIAVADDKQTYSKGLTDAFRSGLSKLGVKEVLYDEITAGEKDYSPLVTKLKQVKADVLYYGGYDAEAGLIVRQMHEQGLKATMVGGDGIITQEFWSIAGATAEGTLMTFPPDPRDLPQNAALVKWFRSQTPPYEPEAYTLYTYADIQVWAEAANKAKSTDTAKVEAALHAGTFDTAVGKIGFNEKGDVKGNTYVLYMWHDGKYKQIN